MIKQKQIENFNYAPRLISQDIKVHVKRTTKPTLLIIHKLC